MPVPSIATFAVGNASWSMRRELLDRPLSNIPSSPSPATQLLHTFSLLHTFFETLALSTEHGVRRRGRGPLERRPARPSDS
jgi:hypothetical protein